MPPARTARTECVQAGASKAGLLCGGPLDRAGQGSASKLIGRDRTPPPPHCPEQACESSHCLEVGHVVR